ncbi:MAG TPA: phasin family protein [Burkholderiaceae bacterium]|nr:phasin family protein [Burkholderiaceae bacterium]
MFATPTQFSEIQKNHLDMYYALSQVALNTTERLVGLNLAALKAAMDESAATTQSMLGIKDAQDMVAVGGNLAQPALHKVVGYSRNVYNIVSTAGAEMRKVVESHIAEGSEKAAEFVEFAAKNAPAGSEPVVSLFRNAVAAYGTAYDTFSKATRQAFEAAESNLENATQAAVNAVTPDAEVVVKTKPKKGE